MRPETLATSVLLALQCADVGALVASEVPASLSLKSDSAETDSSGGLPPPSETYNLLHKHNVLICCCDKCGSTSLYDYVYRALFHKEWPLPGGQEPYRQRLYSSGNLWEREFRRIYAEQLASVKYKFALTRDPSDRLISAWSSKFACDGSVGHVNDTDRQWMVPQLYKLAGLRNPPYCLWLEDFLEVLLTVHRQRRAQWLDSHIKPQQMECFRDLPVGNWTKAVPITDPSFVQELGPLLGAPDLEMPHIHSSNDITRVVQDLLTPNVRSMLEEVTRGEYLALGMRLEDSRWFKLPTSASSTAATLASTGNRQTDFS